MSEALARFQTNEGKTLSLIHILIATIIISAAMPVIMVLMIAYPVVIVRLITLPPVIMLID